MCVCVSFDCLCVIQHHFLLPKNCITHLSQTGLPIHICTKAAYHPEAIGGWWKPYYLTSREPECVVVFPSYACPCFSIIKSDTYFCAPNKTLKTIIYLSNYCFFWGWQCYEAYRYSNRKRDHPFTSVFH